MTVSIILAGKGREVVTIEPNATLAAAVALLNEKRIGALLILGADRRIVGILSERDIVRALAERGAAALDEPVSGAMTRKVPTGRERETVGPDASGVENLHPQDRRDPEPVVAYGLLEHRGELAWQREHPPPRGCVRDERRLAAEQFKRLHAGGLLEVAGELLARGHARSGDALAIAA